MWAYLSMLTLFLIIHNGCLATREVPGNRVNLNSCSETCYPHDCSDVAAQGLKTDGVYLIYPGGKYSNPVAVYCDMTTKDGPWTVFQKRFDGKVDFYRGWKEYKAGFGRADGEYWLGNSLPEHVGASFSTYDSDRDNYPESCAQRFHGAFWYNSCHSANLNGKYLSGVTTEYATGVTWASIKGYYYSFKKTTMMIAPSKPKA